MSNFGNVTCINKLSINLVGNFERFPLDALQSSEACENYKYYALILSAI